MNKLILLAVVIGIISVTHAAGKCPDNEVYSDCIENVNSQGYPRSSEEDDDDDDSSDSDEYFDDETEICDVDKRTCTKGYVCAKNYVRAANGTCIPDECNQPIKCGPNEQLVNCTNACQSDKCPTADNEGEDCVSAQVCGPPACKCAFNYRRAQNGTCIPTEECPPFDCSYKPHLEYNSCPPYCPNGHCSQATPDGECPKALGNILVRRECRPQCRCIKNYYKNDEGDCVPYEQCPGICPENEIYSNCTQAVCNQNCSAIGHVYHCPAVRTKDCKQGCICKPNYCRLENGLCVPKDQCTTQTPTCGVNEILVNCTNSCPSEYCPKSSNEDADCISTQVCGPPACKCRFNHRRAENGTCIPTSECPPFECNGVNEEYNSCPPFCPSDDCSEATPDGKCHRIGRIGIVVPCSPRCRCKKNYWRKNGVCVPYEQCNSETTPSPPSPCPENQELRCVQECPPEKTCRTRGIQYRCQNSEKPCQEKCVCKENYYRNPLGECISNEECDKCPGEHEFFSCGQECDNECKNLAEQNRTNCPIINIVCNPKCYCEDGWARDDNGKCVPVEECPEQTTHPECGHNEVYTCKKSCPPETCLSLVARFNCDSTEVCKPGCYCKDGYLRQKAGSKCVPICHCNELKNSPDCQKSHANDSV